MIGETFGEITIRLLISGTVVFIGVKLVLWSRRLWRTPVRKTKIFPVLLILSNIWEKIESIFKK